MKSNGKKCVYSVQATVEAIASSDAGTIPTLAKQILFKSGLFLINMH